MSGNIVGVDGPHPDSVTVKAVHGFPVEIARQPVPARFAEISAPPRICPVTAPADSAIAYRPRPHADEAGEVPLDAGYQQHREGDQVAADDQLERRTRGTEADADRELETASGITETDY